MLRSACSLSSTRTTPRKIPAIDPSMALFMRLGLYGAPAGLARSTIRKLLARIADAMLDSLTFESIDS